MKAFWLNEALMIKPETPEERAAIEGLQAALGGTQESQLVQVDHQVKSGPSSGLVNQ
jgi:hypothetical protein